MCPLERQDHEYLHLEIVKEPDWEPQRRSRTPHITPPPTPNNRHDHAEKISSEIAEAIEEVVYTRTIQGIDPSRLLVLKFDSINVDLHNAIEERFGAYVVDERVEIGNADETHYHFLVQFPDDTTVQRFHQEVGLYGSEDSRRVLLTSRMRENFFDGLQTVGLLTPEDRMGNRLQCEGFPDTNTLYLDVDLWHPGDLSELTIILDELRSMCAHYGGSISDTVHTSSLLLVRVHGSRQLAEALLQLDFVARVDLPPVADQAYTTVFSNINCPDATYIPTDDDPLVCVIDTGVVAGHPLLANWVIEERDFESGENTPVDINGHGTAVAGLVVYGDIHKCINNEEWLPKVRICSAKVLRHDATSGKAVFPDRSRIEKQTEDAIRYFAQERGCRIFNISLGLVDQIYAGGRQFPWAEKLDELARDLDVVIVVASGNRRDLPIPDQATTREIFREAIRDELLSERQRINSPASACIALTVGAIARTDATYGPGEDTDYSYALAGSVTGAPSPFTRTGPGYAFNQTKAAVKPELVHYGGNLALRSTAGGPPHWVNDVLQLGEPTIQKEANGRIVGAQCGTSLSAPHVAHVAALAEKYLALSLGSAPSANLIRALVGSFTICPPCGKEWLLDEATAMRLVGYGYCTMEDSGWSADKSVRLVAMDEVEENRLQVYRVRIPNSFLQTSGRRGISVSLAYDPPVRSSRKEYVARTMWVEMLKGLTNEEVAQYRAKYNGEDSPPQIPSSNRIDTRPTKTELQWSTLQVMRKEWSRNIQLPIADGDGEPAIHIMVGCQKRFATGIDPHQKYGVVVHLWHEGEQVNLYQDIQTRIRVPASRIRVEP